MKRHRISNSVESRRRIPHGFDMERFMSYISEEYSDIDRFHITKCYTCGVLFYCTSLGSFGSYYNQGRLEEGVADAHWWINVTHHNNITRHSSFTCSNHCEINEVHDDSVLYFAPDNFPVDKIPHNYKELSR